MLFEVPDEITDMTRSLEMVDSSRLIYRTIVFGHRKCSRGYQVHIGSPEGVPSNPGKRYGPYGPRGETHQPQGAGAPPIWAGLRRRRKGEKGKESVD